MRTWGAVMNDTGVGDRGAPEKASMSDGTPLRCILITPARNEAAFIEKTIQSVVNQTVLPIRWVIVRIIRGQRKYEV